MREVRALKMLQWVTPATRCTRGAVLLVYLARLRCMPPPCRGLVCSLTGPMGIRVVVCWPSLWPMLVDAVVWPLLNERSMNGDGLVA